MFSKEICRQFLELWRVAALYWPHSSKAHVHEKSVGLTDNSDRVNDQIRSILLFESLEDLSKIATLFAHESRLSSKTYRILKKDPSCCLHEYPVAGKLANGSIDGAGQMKMWFVEGGDGGGGFLSSMLMTD